METADPELLDLFDKDRLKILTPEEAALKEKRLKDPTTKAIWADLERIARAWATKQPRTLPEDFSARVMDEIRRREASAPAVKPADGEKVSRWRPRIREAVGLALAAGLGGLALGRWVFPVAAPTVGAGGGIAYVCEVTGATVEGKPWPGGRIDRYRPWIHHQQPERLHGRGQTIPQEIRVLAPEAQVCVADGLNGCADWRAFASTVLIYSCRPE